MDAIMNGSLLSALKIEQNTRMGGDWKVLHALYSIGEVDGVIDYYN
jgi:hypothetical protein